MKYSIDKIKLKLECVRSDWQQKVMVLLGSYDSCSNYVSQKITSCRYNYKFGDGEGGLYLGMCPNWNFKEDKDIKIWIIEYNPNKTPDMVLDYLFMVIVPSTSRFQWSVTSFDIACDMDLDFDYLRMLKRDKRESFCKIGKSNLETFYLGKTGESGHVKLYNKAIERKVKQNWSRFEISLKGLNYCCSYEEFDNCCKLPELYSLEGNIDFSISELKDTERIIFEACINDTNLLYTIKNRHTRNKYISCMNKYLTPVYLDKKLMYNTYLDYVYSIFGSYNIA